MPLVPHGGCDDMPSIPKLPKRFHITPLKSMFRREVLAWCLTVLSVTMFWLLKKELDTENRHGIEAGCAAVAACLVALDLEWDAHLRSWPFEIDADQGCDHHSRKSAYGWLRQHGWDHHSGSGGLRWLRLGVWYSLEELAFGSGRRKWGVGCCSE